MTHPLHRFEEFGNLSAAEMDAVRMLAGAPREVPRGRTIRYEGVPSDSFFFLVSGWAASSHVVRNGGRQILQIHLPGDVLGTSSMSMEKTVEHLGAITNVQVAEVRLSQFGRLYIDHPRLAARFTLNLQAERIALMDHLVCLGRKTAEQRIAAFLCDLLGRLTLLGLVKDDSFEVVITQEHIGDILGLTGVHVNRVMRRFANLGLIERRGKRLHILDRAELASIGMHLPRRKLVNPQWLPATC
jgi:CRP-like cAMP-binding protein